VLTIMGAIDESHRAGTGRNREVIELPRFGRLL
jgi:hypothetical protein